MQSNLDPHAVFLVNNCQGKDAEVLVKDSYPIRTQPYHIAPGGGDRFGRKGHNSPLKEPLDLSHGTCKEEGNRYNTPLYRLQAAQ